MTENQQTNNKYSPGSQTILQYLNNTLPAKEERELEEALTEDEMLADALEGLKYLENANDAEKIQLHLHTVIHKKVLKKNIAQTKPLGFPTWLILASLLILILVIVGFYIISKLLD
jgi:hypothetical protein